MTCTKRTSWKALRQTWAQQQYLKSSLFLISYQPCSWRMTSWLSPITRTLSMPSSRQYFMPHTMLMYSAQLFFPGRIRLFCLATHLSYELKITKPIEAGESALFPLDAPSKNRKYSCLGSTLLFQRQSLSQSVPERKYCNSCSIFLRKCLSGLSLGRVMRFSMQSQFFCILDIFLMREVSPLEQVSRRLEDVEGLFYCTRQPMKFSYSCWRDSSFSCLASSQGDSSSWYFAYLALMASMSLLCSARMAWRSQCCRWALLEEEALGWQSQKFFRREESSGLEQACFYQVFTVLMLTRQSSVINLFLSFSTRWLFFSNALLLLRSDLKYFCIQNGQQYYISSESIQCVIHGYSYHTLL